jgi:8-oxo-dGTP pyrophosphatase MutT (NUDIX family)
MEMTHVSKPSDEMWIAARAAAQEHAVRRMEPDARQLASVLIPLIQLHGEPHVVLTVRSHEVEHHKGEISFPGGVMEADDGDLQFTALRESHEEVGIDPSHVEILGEISHHVTRTGFHITPYVGIVSGAPYAYETNPSEVAEILEVPVSHLLDLQNTEERRIQRDGREIRTRSYRWGEYLIFGATAMMLRSFLDEMAGQLGLEC